jgi:HD-GYP domain-containing protein (c-di-GMP phosphodiesterase class II)
MALRLGEVMAALSFASDLALGQPMERALRGAIITVHLGRRAGLSGEELAEAYCIGLLRYIGCNAESDLVSSVFIDENKVNGWLSHVIGGSPLDVMRAIVANIGDDQSFLTRTGMVLSTLARMPGLNAVSPAHCDVARLLAARMGFSERIQTALGQVYERWDGKGVPNGLRGDAIERTVRLVCAAHDIELGYRAGGADEAIARMRARRGAAHDPGIVDVFLADPQAVLEPLDVPSLWDAAIAAEPISSQPLDEERTDAMLRAFGDFADIRSKYTRGHSPAVAALAEAAARALRLPDEEVTALRRAAWVHDIGMSSVPVSMMEKAGKLGDVESERMRLHAYYTERILQRPQELARIGEIAAAAHERLDGQGYHRRLARGGVSIAARVLAAADAYRAMIEPRAYRDALTADAAAKELRTDAERGLLDPDVVEAVLAAAGHARRRIERPHGLSDREVDVLRLVARGLTNKEVANKLGLSNKTVGNHLQSLYPKIGVTTRAGAAMFAMEHDLLD